MDMDEQSIGLESDGKWVEKPGKFGIGGRIESKTKPPGDVSRPAGFEIDGLVQKSNGREASPRGFK
jgi:hypothetical protein